MSELLYCYGTETDWKNKAETKVYSKVLKKIIKYRGKTKALKVDDDVYTEIDIDNAEDEDLIPDNGVYIYGEKPPKKSNINLNKGKTEKVISFRFDTGGQEWAIIKKSFVSDSILEKNSIKSAELELYDPVEFTKDGKDYYMINNFVYDFTDEINSYNWDYTTETEPNFISGGE